ncbi:hypothetical protein AB0L66_22765 [Streptomyces sp. NPDC052207]|uniref:hypothetical protein n=1 Tax=Streptomyces sp. NPDC052207 TaxID=3155418 RepID=UPI00341A3B94
MDVIGVLAASADRLGPMLVQVCNPALGHPVTSLDLNETPDATAHQEVETNSVAASLGLPTGRVASFESAIACVSDSHNPPADVRARHWEQ